MGNSRWPLTPRSVERHHLFPRQYLATLGATGTRQVNAIANMAFLDWAENAKISASAPADYWPVMTAGLAEDRLARQVRLHALPVGWEQLDYATFLERRRELIASIVREGFATLWGRPAVPDVSLPDLLRAGESQTTEFKSTARWNLHTQAQDPRLEQAVVKTVCGFLNAEGGSLFVGVDDEGRPLGLENDLGTLGGKANLDGFELFLRQLLDNGLSVSTAGTVRIRFPRIERTQVCHISVAASGKPVFARPAKGGGEGSVFWVRIGNATKELHGDDMLDYQRDHWG